MNPPQAFPTRRRGRKESLPGFFPFRFYVGKETHFCAVDTSGVGKGKKEGEYPLKKLDAFLSYGGKVCTYDVMIAPLHHFPPVTNSLFFSASDDDKHFPEKAERRASSKNRTVILPHFSLKLKPLPSLIGIFFCPREYSITELVVRKLEIGYFKGCSDKLPPF